MLVGDVESNAVAVCIPPDVLLVLAYSGVGTKSCLTSIKAATQQTSPGVVGPPPGMTGPLLRDSAPWIKAAREVGCGE